MRASSEILKAIRTEVFGESQQVFGKRLPLAKETISRLELHKEGHPVTIKHLELLRGLRAPTGKAEQLQALLKELEAAIWREMQVKLGIEPGAQVAPIAATSPSDRADLDSASAAALPEAVPEQGTPDIKEVAQRVELLRHEEALRAQDVRRIQESLQRTEAAVQRTEQLAIQNAEQLALQRVEQLRLEEAAKRAAQASRMAEEEARSRARRQQAWQLGVVAALVVLVALGGIMQLAGRLFSPPSMADARAENRYAVTPERPDGGTGPGPWDAPPPEEGATSGGLDAGTVILELLKNALPMPLSGLPRQHPAPCPEGIEEMNGYCWKRWSLTPTQVSEGACDELGLYEPSTGWCRANKAGFKPWYGRRKTNNAVDP